jgi:hypothetical protein
VRACFILATYKGVPGKKGCAHQSKRRERDKETGREGERERKMMVGLKGMTGD